MTLGYFPEQRDTGKVRAAAQSNIDLTVCEGSTAYVYHNPVKGLALALMDGDCPREADRVLGKSPCLPR